MATGFEWPPMTDTAECKPEPIKQEAEERDDAHLDDIEEEPAVRRSGNISPNSARNNRVFSPDNDLFDSGTPTEVHDRQSPR